MIVQVDLVLNRTAVDIFLHIFDNLCGRRLQTQSELYHIGWWYLQLFIDLIGELSRDIIGRLSVKSYVIGYEDSRYK